LTPDSGSGKLRKFPSTRSFSVANFNNQVNKNVSEHFVNLWKLYRQCFCVWIRGFVPLTNGTGTGSGSCYFRHRPKTPTKRKNYSYHNFFFLLS
jgi:hypothetical protein